MDGVQRRFFGRVTCLFRHFGGLPFDDLITVDVPTETQTERGGRDEIETTGRQEEKRVKSVAREKEMRCGT